MIVPKQLVEEINSFVAHKALVLLVDKTVPRLFLETPQDIVILRIEFDLILVDVIKQVIRPKDLRDLYELIRITVTMEKRLFTEYHGSEHGTETPHVQAVVVLLEIDE